LLTNRCFHRRNDEIEQERQLRIAENEELPNAPNVTLPLTSSPSIVPLNSSVIGIGSVIDTFQEISSPLTVPSKISVEFRRPSDYP
jgi:hypothetical protein